MNAVVWLGSALFFTFAAEPAVFYTDMRAALKVASESYYPGAIANVVATRYYYLALACAVVALLHLLVEWLYLGKPGKKPVLYLLLGLLVLTLIASNAVQPAMAQLNRKHFTAVQPVDRQSAGRYFHVLHMTSRAFNVLIIGGLLWYTWRIVSPSDTLRFVRPVQFRG
jgi:hypothetical protein